MMGSKVLYISKPEVWQNFYQNNSEEISQKILKSERHKRPMKPINNFTARSDKTPDGKMLDMNIHTAAEAETKRAHTELDREIKNGDAHVTDTFLKGARKKHPTTKRAKAVKRKDVRTQEKTTGNKHRKIDFQNSIFS